MEATKVPLAMMGDTHWVETDRETFAHIWDTEVAAVPEYTDSTVHIVSGLLLPIWKRLPQDSSRVYRLQTDEGERIIGRRVSPAWATNASTSGVTSSLTPDAAYAALIEGRTILDLTEGLQLRRVRVMGANRIELTGFTDTMRDRLRTYGLFSEIISWKLRFFVPVGALGPEIIGKLLDRFPDLVNDVSTGGAQPLHNCGMSAANQEQAALLISRGGDVNLQDRDGWTALHFAADGGHEKVVELLANRDANLDAQAATNGWTALHIAAFYDRRVLANVLLDCGASVGVKSTDGKTALEREPFTQNRLSPGGLITFLKPAVTRSNPKGALAALGAEARRLGIRVGVDPSEGIEGGDAASSSHGMVCTGLYLR